MKNFAVYDEEGTILRTGICQPMDLESQAHEGEFVREVKGDVSDVAYYIKNGKAVKKSKLDATFNVTTIAADGKEEAILSPLAIPCVVIVDGEPILVTDGSFEFSTDDAGVYVIVVDEVAYLREEWEIIAL